MPAVTLDPSTTVDLIDVELVDDLDELLASANCSCSGSDDAPF